MINSRKRRAKRETYQICVTIVEAKHLQQNANPMVVVKVGNRKRRTVVRERTDAPVFNEYFVFDLTCNLDVLLSTRIAIAVYLRNRLKRLKFYGSIILEVATVWDQPDHQYYHKWAMLTNPKNLSEGIKGYVKCNITVNVRGEKLRVHPETDGEDDIEGNLLLPLGVDSVPSRQRARYIFTIYRADGLPSVNEFLGCHKGSENINPYVQISFAGMKGTTTDQRHTWAPRFNERMIFREMFPPLTPRVRIAIKHRITSCRSSVVSTYMLNLSIISNSGEYGFLPTYGPSFIFFYRDDSTPNGLKPGICSQGIGSDTVTPIYLGRLLFALKTEFEEPHTPSTKGVQIEPTAPIVEKDLWRTMEYLLVAVIYDVSMIDRSRFKGKSISFEISLGNAGNRQFPHNNQPLETSPDGLSVNKPMFTRQPEYVSQTLPRTTTSSVDGKYNYLPLGSDKPCIYVKSRWPNFEWRLHNTNTLTFMANGLEEELECLEDLITIGEEKAFERYNRVILKFQESCNVYLRVLDAGRYEDGGGTTELDRHRVEVCRRVVQDLLKVINVNGQLPNNNCLRVAMVHAYRYLGRIRSLCEDPQQSFPDVFLWMMAESKRVACRRMHAGQIIYAEDAKARGVNCGRRVNLSLKMPLSRDWTDVEGEGVDTGDVNACRIEILLWLGSLKYAPACWSTIPPGYVVDHAANADTFPRYVKYDRSSKFQLRAHILQGRFAPGMDTSGLLDPFIRVAFQAHVISTKVMSQTLAPHWDETLVFPTVELHGTSEGLKKQPPQVILEAFDRDFYGARKEFCGRCLATPVVKLKNEKYSPPEFPPQMLWYKLQSPNDYNGSVLASFELVEAGEDQIVDIPLHPTTRTNVYRVPEDIKPKTTRYRLEVVFWGTRDMRRVNCLPVNKPRVVVECQGVHLKSEVMDNARKHSNFGKTHAMVELDMSEAKVYLPSLVIKVYDSRGFGCFKYVGVCVIPTVSIFLEAPITEEEYNARIFGDKGGKKLVSKKQRSTDVILPLPANYDPEREETQGLMSYKKRSQRASVSRLRRVVERVKSVLKRGRTTSKEGRNSNGEMDYDSNDDDALDWWSRYYASLEEERNLELGVKAARRKSVSTFKVYATELELQPEFKAFQDTLTVFELWRGKKSENVDMDNNNFAGNFKGHISVYRWSDPEKLRYMTKSGRSAEGGLCSDFPSKEPVKLLVRIYVIKGINLNPKDPLSGKSDPYLTLRLGKHYVNDRKNYIPSQLNPVFGRLFEIDATLPRDCTLTIQVWDYDATSADDLIGETRIDIENRFYSQHRAHCGIASRYTSSGYDVWRDREKPTQILQMLCSRNNLPSPEYLETDVRIGKQTFPFLGANPAEDEADRQERMALNVLRNWQDFPICGCTLVPEHLERRSLLNSRRPGLEQGKLELWIDMFPESEVPPRAAVNVTPERPVDYELRVTILNTEDVPLVDNQFLTGEKCSDIYVKGWMLYEDLQKTDVHYNSLTGEGNFNWRFIFRFTYSRGERMIVVKKKTHVLARHEAEHKLPCRLNLQVWDSDHFSADDFLGALTLDLARMPRGSGNSKSCSLKLLDPDAPTLDLFRVTRLKAWWPFQRSLDTGTYAQAGKVELELHLIPTTEADEKPVGRARQSPEPLSPPNRPDTSFSWFRNPWKACCFVVCHYYRWRVLCCCSILLFVLLFACGVYAFPGYFVKRLLGA